jgi:hypothetical protein
VESVATKMMDEALVNATKEKKNIHTLDHQGKKIQPTSGEVKDHWKELCK